MSFEKFFEEIDRHLMKSEKPSEYLRQVEDSELFPHFLFEMLYRMRRAKQSSKYHPEGNARTHALVVVDKAAKWRGESTKPRVLM